MKRTIPCLSLVLAIALLLLVACGGGKKENKSAAAPTTPTTTATPAPRQAPTGTTTAAGGRLVGDDCLRGAKSYRYRGTVQAQLPEDQGGGFLNSLGDVTFEGEFVAPDRSHTRLSAQAQTFEVVTIGADAWVRFGNGPWSQAGNNSGPFSVFSPGGICRDVLSSLDGAGVTPTRETVNGVPALRYDFDKQAIGRLNLFGGRDTSAVTQVLPDNTNLTVWLTEKDRWLTRFSLTGSQQGVNATSIAVDLNVTDFNDPTISVEQPH